LWRYHRTLRGSPFAGDALSLFIDDTSLQPVADQAQYPPIRDPMLRKAHNLFVFDFIEKRPDVGIQNPVDRSGDDGDIQRIQRFVLAPAGSKAIGEPQEVRLVDLGFSTSVLARRM